MCIENLLDCTTKTLLPVWNLHTGVWGVCKLWLFSVSLVWWHGRHTGMAQGQLGQTSWLWVTPCSLYTNKLKFRVLYSLLLEALSYTSISCQVEKGRKSWQHGSTLPALPASYIDPGTLNLPGWENAHIGTSDPLILHNTFHSGQCKPRFFHREQARSFFSFTKGSGDPITVALQGLRNRWDTQSQKLYRLTDSVLVRMIKDANVTSHSQEIGCDCGPCKSFNRKPALQPNSSLLGCSVPLFVGPGKKKALLGTSPKNSRIL